MIINNNTGKGYPFHHIETSQLISKANQLSDFYKMGKVTLNLLNDNKRATQCTNTKNSE